MFPIRGKILKPGFRVAEKKTRENPIFSGVEMNAILSGKTQYHCETATVVPVHFIRELLIKLSTVFQWCL